MPYKITSAHCDCKEDNIRNVLLLLKHCRGLCQQDFWGRTPLHLAIVYESRDTLEIFRKNLETQILCKNKENLNTKLINNLKKLIKIYDHDGDTVLHKAVTYNLTEIVKVLLKFCKKFHISVSDSERLGTGDSILHLAVRANLLEMTRTIIEIKPALRYVRNYIGDLPHNEPNLSMEMQMLLLSRRKCENNGNKAT